MKVTNNTGGSVEIRQLTGPTQEGLNRVLRELGRIRDRPGLDFNELAWLGTAIDLLAAYPLPPEDGERARLALWLQRMPTNGQSWSPEEVAALDRAAALLRQPPPPPAAGVGKAEVLAVVNRLARRHPNWQELYDDIEALPEAAPRDREAVMAAVFRCGYNRGIDRAQDFARETASGLGPGGSVKSPAHPDAIAVLRAYARHLEEVVRQEGCPDAAVGALSADEVDRLLTGGHMRAAAPPSGVDREGGRPTIVCLCGSTRFIERFAILTWELERQGNIVLGCTLLPASYCPVPDHFGEYTGTKEQCDELHLRKIDLADEVLVLNVGGYIGESTTREIAYATAIGKPVRYLEAGESGAGPIVEALPEAKPLTPGPPTSTLPT